MLYSQARQSLLSFWDGRATKSSPRESAPGGNQATLTLVEFVENLGEKYGALIILREKIMTCVAFPAC